MNLSKSDFHGIHYLGPVKWVPCIQGTAYPLLADGREWMGTTLARPNCKNLACYKLLHMASDLGIFSGTMKATENGHEIWNLECQEYL